MSLINPVCVNTGKPGYAYVFDSKSGESYIFIKTLAAGDQSKAQLVANLFTDEVVVQKVSRRQLPLKDANDLTKVPEDREVRILEYLNSFVLNPSQYSTEELTPRWTTCVSNDNIPVLSSGPKPRMQLMRVSYWKLCNAGVLADWAKVWSDAPFSRDNTHFPVSLIMRCISQVSETLHVMYQTGPEAVYHCDLHLANIFMHLNLDSNADHPRLLPDFYLGDFGWAQTASEAQSDSEAFYGNNRASIISAWSEAHPGFDFPSPAPGVAALGQRRRWDMVRFKDALESFIAHNLPAGCPKSELITSLQRLMMMIDFLDNQDKLLAAHNPRSRPPSLVELAKAAKRFEELALQAELETGHIKGLVSMMMVKAGHLVNSKSPYVFTGWEGSSKEAKKDEAEGYARANVDGQWSLMESV